MKTVPYFSLDKQPIGNVFQAIGRSYGISIMCDKDVKGDVHVEFHNISLRGLLDALCQEEGYYWTLEPAGYVTIRRFTTVLYQIEYPNLERKGSTKSSIQLGQTNYSGGNNNNGYGGGGMGGGMSGGGGGMGGSGGMNGMQMDQASMTLEQTNDNQFWKSIEQELQQIKADDEKVLLDRFSGTIQATASRHTHKKLAEFLQTVNERIGQQVEIIGKVFEVQLSDQTKLGIDWSLVSASIGDVKFSASTATDTDRPIFGGATFSPSTIAGTVVAGKIAGIINALSEQGDLKSISAPRLVTLNNQSAYIKDTEDRPYFQLESSVRQSLNNSSTSVIDSKEYNIVSISIGTIITVTPHIADNGDITLDITPAITRLNKDVESPGKDSTAPSLFVKQASTIVRLRSGETAIVGGLVTDTESSVSRKVPFLGSIPVAGRLFRSDGKIKTKSELVIFLTPRIIKPGASLSADQQREVEQLSRGRGINRAASVPAGTASASAGQPSVEAISLF